MNSLRHAFALWLAVVFTWTAVSLVHAGEEPFKPMEGQEGKDVVWVPTPLALVEKMLDVAEVTPNDVVMDLGSGDGRNIIAAARRGARAVGVEYNPKMVELSRRNAVAQGVADKATFIEGDMFEADISRATVLALFLLPDNLRRLTAKFLNLAPGTRMVMNTFGVPEWSPDETIRTEGECGAWCTALLYIVPAKVGGTWRLPQGDLTLSQEFQFISGTLAGKQIRDGRLRGDQIMFVVDDIEYTGRVNGDRIEGNTKSGASWSAVRSRS